MSQSFQTMYSDEGSMESSLGPVMSRSSRVSRATVTSLMDKRAMYTIVDEYSNDVTPENITDPHYPIMEEKFTQAAFDSRPRFRSQAGLKAAKRHSVVDHEQGMKVYATTIHLDDMRIDNTLNTEDSGYVDDESLQISSSAYYLPKSKLAMTYPPDFFLILKENETEFLFEQPSFSVERATAEGAAVEQENEFYQYITVGKGRNRKMVTEETQTKASVSQTRHTMATRPQIRNASVFASMWDMHDTYEKLKQKSVEVVDDEMVMYQAASPSLLRKKKQVTTDDGSKETCCTLEQLATNPRFLDAVVLIERVLATGVYSRQQKMFRGLVVINNLSLDLKYVYTLQPLWKFECDETADRAVTYISFNPANENILAVGYGKFAYAENKNGLICVWCSKSPCRPERKYVFDDPVSAVKFSEKNPNWLACGLYNGDVLILDITFYEKKTIAKSTRTTNPCFEPIWMLNWRLEENLQNEYVMTTCEDGRINRFTSTKTHDFICTPMMRLVVVEGKLKGMEAPDICVNADVPIRRHPAALCMHWHPKIEHVYYVGTDEGCIHKCSIHYLNQHMEVYRAHSGPVYDIQFSPFMNTLMMTCGADNAIRLWLEGIDDIIMTLNCSAAVYGVTFCPINSTVIVSTSGNVLSIWDLRRKTHIPCAEYTFPTNTVLTYVHFTTLGDNLVVGDTTGRVHTFHLEDMPIAPFYQKKLLDEAIRNALCTRPQLLKQLNKMNKFNQ